MSRIRERYGLEIFRRFFEMIAEQCLAAGLVWGKELYVDATKVEANASLDSVAPRFAVEAHLGALFLAADTSEDVDEGGDGEGPMPLPIALTSDAQDALAKAAAWRSWTTESERHSWGLPARGRFPR